LTFTKFVSKGLRDTRVIIYSCMSVVIFSQRVSYPNRINRSNADGVVGPDAPDPDVDAGVVVPVGAFDDAADICKDFALLREYTTDCVKPYTYFSFHAHGDDGELGLRAFQILAHPRKMTLVKTVGSSPASYRRTYNAMSLGVWNLHTLGLEPSKLECHEEFTEEIDIASLMSGHLDLRTSFRIWTRIQSDHGDGFFTLCNPEPPKPTSSIDSAKFPILALWDALNGAEYVWVAKKCVHKARSAFFYRLHRTV
jgi:hypothetical protein